MIKCINGDILNCTEDIIAHQVNTLGIMGGGLALQIRNHYPNIYKRYHQICKNLLPYQLMGQIFLSRENINSKKIIANIFAQSKIREYDGELCTDYDMLRKGLNSLLIFARDSNKTIALPYKLGCGLAGGDWENVVFPMIKEIFEEYGVTIYSIEGEFDERQISEDSL